MFPIRDHNPSSTRPVVTQALIAINVVMFLVTAPWLGGMVGLWENLALYPVAVANGYNVWGLLTHMFLHAGLLHLGGNMLFLWIFGDNLEEQMGHAGFLVFYLLGGLAAAGFQMFADIGSGIPMVGASGAIFGLAGALIARNFVVVVRRRLPMGPLVRSAATLVVLNVALALLVPQIAWQAHLGGFATGAAMGVAQALMRPRRA